MIDLEENCWEMLVLTEACFRVMDPKVCQDYLTERFGAVVAYFKTVQADVHLKAIQSDSDKGRHRCGGVAGFRFFIYLFILRL